MKTVISVSLGSSDQDFEFEAQFLDQRFKIKRIGVDQDTKQAELLINQWQYQADAIALEGMRDHQRVGTFELQQKLIKRLENLSQKIPVMSGTRLREILQEWAVHHTQEELKSFFSNSKVLVLSGMNHFKTAQALSLYTDNLSFADPVVQLGVPKFLTSLDALAMFAKGTHQLFRWSPPHVLSPSINPIKEWNHFILRKAIEKADVVVGFFEEIERYGLEELAGKTVISGAISAERLQILQDKGVYTVLDYTPQPFSDQTISLVLLEALIIASLDHPAESITDDDFLEIISQLGLKPRILYPDGFKRMSRFAFVIHPLSQQYFRNAKPLGLVTKISPPMVMNTLEKIIAHAPPMLYSKVTGIRSPTGAEAEGWLITVGGTPREIMAHSPEFTYRRLLAAGRMAKKLGAQIMGLGAFTKVVGDAGITVAKRAPLPITTGNSYSASGALWAAHDAIKKLGLAKLNNAGKLDGKAMVVGATGSIGSVCARLLAKGVREVYLAAPDPARLLTLKESIEHETPDAVIHVLAHADKMLHQMDMIVTATSGAGKKILDIMKVKPGCVITDVARPLDIPAEDVAKRPDVLVIESGEIRLPGDVQMKSIGLPKNVVYACLAETIVLTLEGRFENFTVGREIEWQKVREIYKLGLKHGMQLASISGVNGIFTDADIAQVRERVLNR